MTASDETQQAERGTLAPGESHPAAEDALNWFRSQFANPLDIDMSMWLEAFSSCAIESNRLGEICSETLNRIRTGQGVSDRYLLGLVWAMARHLFDTGDNPNCLAEYQSVLDQIRAMVVDLERTEFHDLAEQIHAKAASLNRSEAGEIARRRLAVEVDLRRQLIEARGERDIATRSLTEALRRESAMRALLGEQDDLKALLGMDREGIAVDEMTDCPMFYLQRRDLIPTNEQFYNYDPERGRTNLDGELVTLEDMLECHNAVESWCTVDVFLTRGEAEAFANGEPDRFPHGHRVKCLPARGRLADLLDLIFPDQDTVDEIADSSGEDVPA